jgi:hypothetical protein
MRYRRAGNKSMGFSVLQTGFEGYPNPALEPALKKDKDPATEFGYSWAEEFLARMVLNLLQRLVEWRARRRGNQG